MADLHLPTVRTLTRVSAVFSLLGDFIIIYGCMRKGPRHWSTYFRIIFFMTLSDLIASTGYMISDYAIPPPDGEGWQSLCIMQGAFEQVGLGAILLNAALSLNYFLILKLEWPADYIEGLEPYGFAFVFIFTFICTVAPIPLNLYHNAIIWCWIADLPADCTGSSAVECAQGNNAFNYQLYFFYVPLWFCIIFTFVMMSLVVSVVYRQDRAVRKMVESERKKFETTKRIIIQAALYVGAFVLTYIFVTILRVQDFVTGSPGEYTTYLAVFFVPLQGLFNLAGFIFPRTVNARTRLKNAPLRLKILYVFFVVEASTVQKEMRKRANDRPRQPSQSRAPNLPGKLSQASIGGTGDDDDDDSELGYARPDSSSFALSQNRVYESEDINSSYNGTETSPPSSKEDPAEPESEVHEIERSQL
ncbi:G-protein coupled receptor 1 [Hondaea fermentalgiana]|uniref:G-protein coupled receptor 1 n=1 Tax=Hondaea fermentalgiana TaxID=2315210 RepID=A0A2R5GAY1_9STRA|nr:G-protein coupled receptor 1 [Hondaea fermentalgiana]|eukprot:GBG28167.1 G-protein coupled receptor 1 [Hondaea fermentalgiana]